MRHVLSKHKNAMPNIKDTISIHEYRYADLHLMPEMPGIYAWFIMPNAESIGLLINLHNNLHIDLNGKGKFNEYLIGSLYTEKLDFKRDLNFDYLQQCIHHIAAPIYIGISKTNLMVRLNQHKQKINYFLSNPSKTYEDQETDKEELVLNIFAFRIAKLMLDSNYAISEKDVFVKAITLPININNSTLVNTEFFLNRSIKPSLGTN